MTRGFYASLGVAALLVAWFLWESGDGSSSAASDASEAADTKPVSKHDGRAGAKSSEASYSERMAARAKLAAANREPPLDEGERIKLHNAQLLVFHGWHRDATLQLVDCLPLPNEHARPQTVHVVFQELPLQEDAAVEGMRNLEIAEARPAFGEGEPPERVRQCLSKLVGTTVEVPERSPRLQSEHLETIEVMWEP